MGKYLFTVTLVGRGDSVESAWDNAKVNSYEDPVQYDKAYRLHQATDWEEENVWSLADIRKRIRDLAAKHDTLRAMRFVIFDKEDGVLTIHDIMEFEGLADIHKKYKYGGWVDREAKRMVGKLIIIEGVPYAIS